MNQKEKPTASGTVGFIEGGNIDLSSLYLTPETQICQDPKIIQRIHSQSSIETRLLLAPSHVDFLREETERLGWTFSRLVRSILDEYIYEKSESRGNDVATRNKPSD